jgi:hypothetical protein
MYAKSVSTLQNYSAMLSASRKFACVNLCQSVHRDRKLPRAMTCLRIPYREFIG